jgi:subtilisin family serine protease
MVSGPRPTPRRRILHLVAAVGAVCATILVASPAQGASAPDGHWWYDAYGVEQVHAEGLTGEGLKIAVIDAQINPDLPDFAGADLTVAPGAGCMGAEPATDQYNADSSHGSTVTAMLIGNGSGPSGIRGIAPDASVTFYGFGPIAGECPETPEAEAAELSSFGWLLQRALADGADIVTTSTGGGNTEFADSEIVAEAIARQVPILASVPNDAGDGVVIPWSYDGVIAVNAVDANQQLLLDEWNLPNKALDTTVAAPGGGLATIGFSGGTWADTGITSGSSLSTPLVAGIIALSKQKYPEATSNQLVQSLVHNTGAEDHELEYSPDDGYGYGVASLGHVLRVDPTGYEDVNPLLDKPLDQPSQEQIQAAIEKFGAASPAPSSTDVASGDPQEPDAGAFTAFIIGAAVVAVLIIAAVIVTIVLVRRSHRNNREAQS